MTKKLTLIAAALAFVAVACGGDDEATTETTAAPTTQTTAAPTTEAPADDAPGAAAVMVAGSALGDILTDQEGNALYLFLPDEQGPSVCNDGCAAAWPPLFEAVAGDGIDASLLGSATRDDGSEQVTYNGWPLYYYAADAGPGDVNGQGANDVWFVLDASGSAVGIP